MHFMFDWRSWTWKRGKVSAHWIIACRAHSLAVLIAKMAYNHNEREWCWWEHWNFPFNQRLHSIESSDFVKCFGVQSTQTQIFYDLDNSNRLTSQEFSDFPGGVVPSIISYYLLHIISFISNIMAGFNFLLCWINTDNLATICRGYSFFSRKYRLTAAGWLSFINHTVRVRLMQPIEAVAVHIPRATCRVE